LRGQGRRRLREGKQHTMRVPDLPGSCGAVRTTSHMFLYFTLLRPRQLLTDGKQGLYIITTHQAFSLA
jgi:hypothetical protein